jgi:hypothetical protein
MTASKMGLRPGAVQAGAAKQSLTILIRAKTTVQNATKTTIESYGLFTTASKMGLGPEAVQACTAKQSLTTLSRTKITAHEGSDSRSQSL